MSPTPAAVSQSAERAAAVQELTLLLRRAEAGEATAQTELVARYSRRLTGFIRPIIRDVDSVADVTQTIYIKMFRRLSRLREPAHFEAWLFTLARNSCLDFLRRRRCRLATQELDEQAHQVPDTAQADASAEIMVALERALTRLSPLDRTLVSQVVAGERYGAIASRTGLSVTAVKVRLHRVRPFLRAWVGEMTATRQRGHKGWHAGARSRLAA